jgi:hypothetical protein
MYTQTVHPYKSTPLYPNGTPIPKWYPYTQMGTPYTQMGITKLSTLNK